MSLLKKIPKVDKVLEWQGVKTMLADHPRDIVLMAVRTALENLRTDILRQDTTEDCWGESAVTRRIDFELAAIGTKSLKRVINGTGVVLHTNLGRAPLADGTKSHLDAIAFSYSNLEYELDRGERGSRYTHVEKLLCKLTGAEAALVVNNNAAAVLLALSSLAIGREVIVSRGELVEIGGSFRIPDVMKLSGALLREVGTTNRTHARDYQTAVTPDTGLLLKVHCSNFAQVGFVAEVPVDKLVCLGKELSLPVMMDAGSGSLINLEAELNWQEPSVQELVKTGVDVVTFSGDKLLGGPQAGIIIGREDFILPMKKHPLLRALRIDKLTLAALESTLHLYQDKRRALQEIPVLRMLTEQLPELTVRTKKLVRNLRQAITQEIKLTLLPGSSQVGGGALPLVELPTVLVAITVAGMSPQDIESRLRNFRTPVIGRITKGNYTLDPRTIMNADTSDLAAALRTLSP